MMKSMHRGLTLAAFTLVAGLQSAAAAPVNAQASASTISPCPSFCGGAGLSSAFDSDGGPGDTTAHAQLDNVDGQGEAQADLSGMLGLPSLQAKAASHAAASGTRSSRVAAAATGLRQFLYSGPDTVIDLLIDLHGSASAANVNDARLQAQVIAYTGPDLDLFHSDYGTFRFEIIPGSPELTLLDETTVILPTNTGVGTVEGSVTLELHDGDSFFIWAQILASGIRGGAADGFGTLTLSFSDPLGITPVGPAPVPVPAAFWLLGSALGGLALNRRRRG